MHDCSPGDLEAESSLLLAVVAASQAPLLLSDGDCLVIAASASFIRTFDLDSAAIEGRPLTELGRGEWNMPQVRSLLSATASGFAKVGAYEIDLIRPHRETRRLVLGAQKLSYSALDKPRLLLTVSDVTDARSAEKMREKLLSEKTVLLQELQHRVANSLQIIASVLMQSARRVRSEETRLHLYNAHHRVMSVAAVQQQLDASRIGEVEMRIYLAELCQSISASMIADDQGVTLAVDIDGSRADADFSTSVGLIVTELVINALKHAYPDRSGGAIKVSYSADEANWTLAVADDGVGMPLDPKQARPGLGTSIVGAIAAHLSAVVQVTNTNPGTLVSVTRSVTDVPLPVLEAV